MAEDRLLSSAPPSCLIRASPSSQKGGTLIAEEVTDLATHERRLDEVDAYRPPDCGRCGAKMHAHDQRTRLLVGHPARMIAVRRYRCAARKSCGAVWQVLPAFVARCLWRSWETVEETLEEGKPSEVPKRTRRRWQARLEASGRDLVVLLATTGERVWEAVVAAIGLDACRGALVGAYRRSLLPAAGHCLAELAGLVHRLRPGVRLM